jgi:toxin ParE1/3/4
MKTNEKTICFRALAEKIEALDSMAAAQDRPRSYLINEAITNYIELHAYQDALVRKGMQDMRNRRVVAHEERILGTRELIISNTPFIAAYTVEKNRIVILALYHGAQYWPEQL